MSTTAVAVPGSPKPDPWKRVNYTHGLVLGVDEFVQEQAFFLGKDHLHNRMLHGYGTVAGLQVKLTGSQLSVSPGLAVDPAGREIRVCGDMCASLSDWVTRNAAYLPDGKYDVHLVLCYRECQTDSVPVPGEPCRTQADALAASRVTETFELRLRIPETSTPNSEAPEGLYYKDPTQPAEDLVRAFGDLLERIQITSDATAFMSGGELENLVRNIAPGWMPSTPIYLDPATARDLLRRAFLVWVTEVRPKVLKQELGDPCDPDDGGCVLLAEVTVSVSGRAFKSADPPVTDRRPYLLDTRILQEWLLCERQGAEAEVPARVFATVQRLPRSGANDSLRVWLHCPEVSGLPLNSVMYSVNGNVAWSFPDSPQVLGGNVFVLPLRTALPADARVTLKFDATYMPLAGGTGRKLTEVVNDPAFSFLDRSGNYIYAYFACTSAAGDLVGTYPDPTVVKLQGRPVSPKAPADGDVLAWGPDSAGTRQWLPGGPGGDLGGMYPAPNVVGLRGRPVDPAQPTNGQVLTYNAGKWAPAAPAGATLPAGQLDVSGTYPSLNVVGLRGKAIAAAAATPTDGQVLTYQGGEWTAAAAPSPSFLPGQRDVTGTYPTLTVRGLQTHPVSAGDPRSRDLLVWLDPLAIVRLADADPDQLARLADGLHSRTSLPGDVARVLDQLAPDPKERATLMENILKGAMPPELAKLPPEWCPFPPAVVGTPVLAAEGYSMVAAGSFDATDVDLRPTAVGVAPFPTLNRLRFDQGAHDTLPSGEPIIVYPGVFDGYFRPDSSMLYIVKATYFPNGPDWPRPLRYDFSRDNFTLTISAAVGQRELKVDGRVTVEISRIDRTR